MGIFTATTLILVLAFIGALFMNAFNGTNTVLLLAFIASIVIWVWLIVSCNTDSNSKTARLTGKLRGMMPGSSIRIQVNPSEDEASLGMSETEANTETTDTKS